MGKADTIAKDYMRDTRHFADAFNFLLYKGTAVIDPEDLIPMDPVELSILNEKSSRQYEQRPRDVLKLWSVMKDQTAVYAILGIENQTYVHYAMPVKNMLYDAMNYAEQVKNIRRSLSNPCRKKRQQPTSDEFLSGFCKTDKLLPVITLVISFNASEWDGPRTIHEMINTEDDSLLRFVQDYKINLIEPARLSEDDFTKFQTSLGAVMEYIKYSRDKKRLKEVVRQRELFQHLDQESATLINTVTNSQLTLENKKGEINMCKAIDDLREEAREEGRLLGIEQGIKQGIEKGIEKGIEQSKIDSIKSLIKALDCTPERAMGLLDIPEQEQPRYRKMMM